MKPHNEKLKEYSDIWKITLLPTLIYFSEWYRSDAPHSPNAAYHNLNYVKFS